MKKRIVYVTVLTAWFLFAFLLGINPVQGAQESYEGLASKFLQNVAGFDTNRYSIGPFHESTAKMPNSQHYVTSIDAEITGNNIQLDARIDLIDGRMWTYDLSGNFGSDQLAISELLIAANNHLNAYEAFSNESRMNALVGLLFTSIQTQASKVENENFSLNVLNNAEANCSRDAVTIEYCRKINGYTFPGDCFSIHISKNGLLSSVVDDAVFPLATTAINVTRDEAIALATANATAYANEFGQTITATNATLVYVRDVWSTRGDDLAMYPEWDVSFMFDKANNESVSEYGVLIWADNGQLFYGQPQEYYLPTDIHSSVNVPWQIVAFATGLFILFPITVIFTQRRAKAKRGSR